MNAPIDVIIDCDPGIDDSLALLLALNSPELNVIGITTISGNVPARLGANNALKILQFAGRLDIPVYIGESQPLKVDYISAQDTHGDDGLGNSQLPNITAVKPHEDAVDFIINTLTVKPATRVLALGPLTNIAKVLQTALPVFQSQNRFVLMGGNYKSHGNCSPVAEYNFWCDPDAARIVFNSMPQTIEMVGLDVTRKIVFTPSMLSYIQRTDPKVGWLMEKITKFYFDFHWEYEKIIGCVINDPLAVAYLIDPSILTGFNSYTTIANQGVSRGQSIVDDHDFWHHQPNSKILTNVDTNKFWHLFLTRVANASEPQLSATLNQLLGGAE
ncbi:nucleoside hydrolase [Paucilactobacillus suebicus]|uniref:Purine nucleosidase n=1 Tax=Paucilactobacillus suebicus DSM 5007 = KCTC 3549 TaxID=1423807 RepID=A0A0R1VV73_9LACO|nr:nucleoside hydrolase [Paucilactobacillus suebicus]KRM09665.1 purine nucleosidase [Paucilactobacillus suebicus DSM 5007 = KCTC 3549]